MTLWPPLDAAINESSTAVSVCVHWITRAYRLLKIARTPCSFPNGFIRFLSWLSFGLLLLDTTPSQQLNLIQEVGLLVTTDAIPVVFDGVISYLVFLADPRSEILAHLRQSSSKALRSSQQEGC